MLKGKSGTPPRPNLNWSKFISIRRLKTTQQRMPCRITWKYIAYRHITSVDVVRIWFTFFFFQHNTRMVICWEEVPFIDIDVMLQLYLSRLRTKDLKGPSTAFYYTTIVKALLRPLWNLNLTVLVSHYLVNSLFTFPP